MFWQGLHDIVTQANFPLAALRSWAILKPCHVDPLASLVLESLDEWPYTIHIFCVFASIEAFRDAILRQQPTVLDELLGRSLTAVSKHDASQTELNRPTPNDYATACVALLSTPLPESFLAPARLPAFISSLIQHMVEQPCAETISPLHQVMTGISGNQLEILPEETLSKFQSECTQVLRNMNDHVGNLLCLAIFAKISTTARKKTEAGPPVQGKWMQSICQFFDATRGVKTLDLAVLRAILACSASSNFSLQERIQCIELATEVCSAVDPAQRQEWILKNKVKIVKLCGKILRPDIDVQVQMRGLSFVTTLLPSEILPGEIIQSVFTILTSEHGRRCLCDISSDLLSSMIIATAKRFNQTQMSTCLKIVMSLFDVREESKMTTLSIGMMATVTTSVLPGLLKAARDSQPAKSTTFASLSGDRDISWFTRGGLISLQQRHDNCTQSPFCPCGSSRLYNELQLSFATLVLEALSPSLDTGASTQQAEICKFLSTLIRSMSDVAARPAVSLGSSAKSLHTLPTLHLPNASQDWRSKLAQNLTGHAEQFHGLVIQQMGQICRDLETRCNTVEEPLRSAREELGKLGAQYETCKQQRDKLMCKEAEVQTAMSALEAENQRLRQRAENAENRAHSLSSRLQTTQNELENSIRSGREALDHAEQRARDAELKYMATLTAKEDAIEERQEEIDGLKVELEQLAAQVEESTIREAETRCHAESLQVEVTSLRENLRVGNEKIAEGEEEIRKLNAQNDSLDAGIRDLQKQFDQNVTEMANIQADLQHNEETFQQEIASMKQQQQEIEERKSEIQKLQASIRTTKSKVIQALQTRDKKIETLKNELDALKRERTARAREFAKAQEYSNRLMAVFKAEGSTFSEAGTPKNRRPSAAQPLISPLSQRRFSTDFFDETDTHLLVTDSFDSCPSSNAEPTPKRPRSSRAQQPQQTPPSKQRTSSAAVLDIVDTAKRTRGSHVPASSHRRRPLSATSGNSPTKPDRKSFRLSDSQETVFEGTTSTVQDEADMTTIMMMSTMDPGSEFSRLDFSDENLFTGTGTRSI
ncbi:hypothetical protein AJ80_01615 [Polytolypa hystricis UAMH7299]|uniref:Uncharacterized protein n=1 Tax=Polytolypa hystricis (strain UAMH7299) TaxID=1447883 RepID=A0A2B7Z0A4_POLH7|nr:hypothetical protein AJ80_01615 [Polytolypa hystricis UAMH7299]